MGTYLHYWKGAVLLVNVMLAFNLRSIDSSDVYFSVLHRCDISADQCSPVWWPGTPSVQKSARWRLDDGLHCDKTPAVCWYKTGQAFKLAKTQLYCRCSLGLTASHQLCIFCQQLGVWLDKAFRLVKGLPRYLVPCYFDAIVTPLYLKLLEHSWAHMSRFGLWVASLYPKAFILKKRFYSALNDNKVLARFQLRDNKGKTSFASYQLPLMQTCSRERMCSRSFSTICEQWTESSICRTARWYYLRWF